MDFGEKGEGKNWMRELERERKGEESWIEGLEKGTERENERWMRESVCKV